MTQHLVATLLGRRDWWDDRLALLRRVYRERCEVLVGALTSTLGERIEVAPPGGGLFLWARLPGVDTEALLPRALAADLAFVPGRAFAVEHAADDRVRLSFATLAPPDLEEAAGRLASVVLGAAAVAASTGRGVAG